MDLDAVVLDEELDPLVERVSAARTLLPQENLHGVGARPAGYAVLAYGLQAAVGIIAVQ